MAHGIQPSPLLQQTKIISAEIQSQHGWSFLSRSSHQKTLLPFLLKHVRTGRMGMWQGGMIILVCDQSQNPQDFWYHRIPETAYQMNQNRIWSRTQFIQKQKL